MNEIRPHEDRLAIQRKLLHWNFLGFCWREQGQEIIVEGWVRTRSGRDYKLRLSISGDFPQGPRRLGIVSPRVLRTRDGRSTLNAAGASHRFHTGAPGPGGCLQVDCPSMHVASATCVAILLGGIAWCEAYETYLATGRDIDALLSR